MMWGSNVPVTRTPDAHWMAEVRYRGTKVVSVSPDYADNTKFADEWLPAQAGTDAALAMAMGHVILSEYFVANTTEFFDEYVRSYSDLPFLVHVEQHEHGLVAGKFLTADELAGADENDSDAVWKTVVLDEQTGAAAVPNGSLGFRRSAAGEGRWNLDLEGITPALTLFGRDDAQLVEIALPAFDAPDGSGSVLRRGVPTTVINGHQVTTVFDLMLAQYGVHRDGMPGDGRPATTTRRPPTRRPGRRRSPACLRRQRSGLRANSPPTQSIRADDR